MKNSYINFEISTLGAVMFLKGAMPLVATRLKAEHFSDTRHSLIFASCLNQFRKGSPIDVQSICHDLSENKTLEKAGGRFYLMEIVDNCIGMANLKYHAFKIIEAYVLRSIEDVSSKAMNKAKGLENPLEISGELINKLVSITSEIIPEQQIQAWDYCLELLKNLQALSRVHYDGETMGVNTGFPSINRMTDGFHPGELIIMAGRPGMGKTTMASSLSVDMGYRHPVLFFTLEMDGENVMKKILSKESGVDYQNVRTAKMGTEEWSRVIDATGKMKDLRLIIDDNPVHTITTIRASIMRAKGQFPDLSCVFIDQLNFIKPEGESQTKDQEIGKITRGLKMLAREMKIPIVLLSQLNRSVESTPGKIPMLSHLRDSGNIEQDADLVILMYRPEYYRIDTYDDGSSTKNSAMAIIAKQRNGQTGIVKLIFEGEFSRFRDSEGNIPPPPGKEDNGFDFPKPDEDEGLPF